MTAQPEIKAKMTAEEFFQLPESSQIIELIHGEVTVSPTPIPKHGIATMNAAIWLTKNIADGRVFHSPMDVYLDDEEVLQPDVFWISGARLSIISEKRIDGAPDLVVEVFSPSTAQRDRTVKFDLYEKHGVREYWMIDPVNQYMEVYQLVEGAFKRQGVYGIEDTFASSVLGGKVVDVKTIFA